MLKVLKLDCLVPCSIRHALKHMKLHDFYSNSSYIRVVSYRIDFYSNFSKVSLLSTSHCKISVKYILRETFRTYQNAVFFLLKMY